MKMVVLWVGLGATLIVAGAFWFFWSMGEPRYHPGDTAKAVAAGLPADPVGPIVQGALRADGSREWSLEVEPNLQIRGVARGEGSPVVVIHGGPGFPPEATWAGLDAFSQQHRFWYPHQRGSGWSDRPIDRFPSSNFPANVKVLDERLGMVPQIADIERLRRALGVERLDLVGHSFGGLIACLYAVEFPNHVGRLLLIAPAALVQFPPPSGGLYEEIRRSLPQERRIAYDQWLKAFFDYGALFGRSEAELSTLNAGVIPFYREAIAGRSSAQSPDGTNPNLVGGWMTQALFFSLGQRHDWRPALAQIRTPVTLVFGEGDLSPPDDWEPYRVIPGLRVEKLPGNHFLADQADPLSGSALVRDALQ